MIDEPKFRIVDPTTGYVHSEYSDRGLAEQTAHNLNVKDGNEPNRYEWRWEVVEIEDKDEGRGHA